MADQDRHTGGAPAPPVPGNTPEVFQALAAFRAADTREAAERVRSEYCALCQATPDEERDTACASERCGLRTPTLWLVERLWVEQALASPIFHQRPPPAAELEVFNAHIASAAGAPLVIALNREDERRKPIPLLGYRAATLRGRVHGGLVFLLALHQGIVVVNADAQTTREIRAHITEQSRLLKEWKRREVVYLRDHTTKPPPSWAEIARRVGTTEDTAQDWYKEAKALPPRARRRPKGGGNLCTNSPRDMASGRGKRH